MITRQITVKTILWAIVGILSVLTVIRFIRGLGATTALTDATPWGFWIAFDVMAGVALAAGGFVMAGTVYIFGRSSYRPYARPAILTAFLGYSAVAVGLLYDLGLPWHIWHPIVYPQHHSVLFEVAMCVILYLTVLFLEFAPVILEHRLFSHPFFAAVHDFLKRFAILFVIAGIVLSTLHQSSLGSLFLITPHRLHALWYSPIIWVLYFFSAVGLGLMMVVAESYFSSWFFGHRLRMVQLSGLGRVAAYVLLAYLCLRLVDLAVRGIATSMFDGSWQSNLFLFEISLSALIPGVLLSLRRVRKSKAGLGLCSAMAVFGIIGYRFDTCIVAFARPEGMSYVPSWMEVAVSLGIVAGALLVFIFFVERLNVYDDERQVDTDTALDVPDRNSFNAATVRLLLPSRLANPRRYSMAFVTAAAVTIALIPRDTLFGTMLVQTPVDAARTLTGIMNPRGEKFGNDLRLATSGGADLLDGSEVLLLSIDGNRNGRVVLFAHDHHVHKLGGKSTCGQCHHRNMPLDQNTSCCECHRDMYTTTDIFDHSSHIQKFGKNSGCRRCHQSSSGAKSRNSSIPCSKCHEDMIQDSQYIEAPPEGVRGFAPGYMNAMHGLCITCHRRTAEENLGLYGTQFDKCATCHRDSDIYRPQSLGPYASE